MCGILGHIPSCNEFEFRSALDLLQHRGPDGFGIWKEDNIILGHRRLSILDLSENGKQPMHYMHYTITFNGEIYNFIELREKLRKKGYQFTSESDTEVLMAAYDCYGPACVNELNGMWAFALWNKNKKELFLSRDRFGVKPLFYYQSGSAFAFASEMKALMPFLPEISVSDEFDWMKQNIFDYEQTDKCLVKNIKRFPAGSNAVYNLGDGTLKISKFWDTKANLQKVPVRYEEQVEQFRELFIDACKIRMRSDVTIGTALSGGLDSSSTICTMANIGKNNPGERVSADWQHAVIASFPGTFLDESVYAKRVTDFLGINAQFVTIDAAAAIPKLEDDLYYFEELYITSPVPMMETYKAIRNAGLVVTLDGHGADELFSSYGKAIFNAFLDCNLNLSKVNDILHTYEGLRDVDSEQVVKEDIGWHTYYEWMRNKIGSRKKLAKYVFDSLTGRGFKEQPDQAKFGRFNSHLYSIYHRTILPTLLRNYDRYAMANSVEIRMPFMDYRLASFCFSLPWDSKLRGGYTKAILRDAMKDIVPDDIRLRTTKIGFNSPIVDWMKGSWKEYLTDTIHSQNFLQCSLIDSKGVQDKVMKVIHEPATFQDGEAAWTMLTPYLWEKSFLKRDYKLKVAN